MHQNLMFDSFAYTHKLPVFPNAAFDNLMPPIFGCIQKKIIESTQLTNLRDFLLPLLMNGQVRVREKAREG
jgi:type I restriction enzyme S subunit